MNKTQLAKLLIKHPEIKSLYESRAFDTSTINKVIAEEIMEADLSAAQKDEIETLRTYLDLFRRQAGAIMDELKDARLDGDEEGIEELSAELADTKQKRSEVLKKIKAIEASVEKAAEEANATESPEDDQQVAQAIKKTADAMKPAVDAASQGADIEAKVDAVEPAVQDVAQVAQAELGDIEIEDEGGSSDNSSDAPGQESTEVNREEIKRKVYRATNAISRSFTISDYPNDLSAFLDKEDVEAGGRNGDLIAVNIDQKSSKAILLCYLISRVAGASDGSAIAAFSQNGFPIMSPSPLGLTPAKYSEALSKLGLTTTDAKEIFKAAQMPLNSALKALMKSNQRGGKRKFKNEIHEKQIVMLPFVRKFTADSSISEIITSATSEPTQQGGVGSGPEASEDPTPQPPTKKGIKIAQGAIRGRDVDTTEVTPEEVKTAIEQDKEEISANPEMKDNAEELVQKVQEPESELPADNEEVIRALNDEIESFKAMLENPQDWELNAADVEEVKQGIADRTAELEKLGVAVAKTDSKEDDQAVTQALQAAKPEIEQAKTSDDGKPDMAALDAAIAQALQNAQSGAKGANDELDLSDIEIVDDESDLADQTISSVVQDVSAVDVAKTIGTLALDIGKNLLPSGVKNSITTGLDFLNDQELWLKAAESAIKGNYDRSAEIVAKELVEKVQERFELASFEEGSVLKTVTIAAMKPALSTGIKLAVESAASADDVIDGVKDLYGGAKETIEQAFTPSEEGTQEAIEAIENEVPENVENIEPADVDAAKKEKESEIAADPEKKANAEELETKVEKDKMPTETKPMKALQGIQKLNDAFSKAQAKLQSALNDESTPAGELPQGLQITVEPINAMDEVRQQFQNAESWEDLENANIWPTAIKTRREKGELPEWERWKEDNMKQIDDLFNEKIKELESNSLAQGPEASLQDIQNTLVDTATAIGNTIQNSDATGEDSGEDVGGSDVQGQSDLETIAKILPDLKEKLPNLFKFQGFVKNLAQALMGGSSDAAEGGDGVDATGDATSSDINATSDFEDGTETGDVGGLKESLSGIYLAEEEIEQTDDTDESGADQTGKPLDVADAEVLKRELEELRKVLEPKKISVDDLITPDLKKALGMETETETTEVPSVEEAAEEGQNAAQSDSELEDARYQDLYAGFKKQMDEFFSKDGANDGFMDQFLLKYQGAKLAALIGNLDLIIGGGTKGADEEGEARAFSDATQQADDNLNEEQGQEISEKGQLELKTRLVAMLKGLKSLRSMMNSYKENSTRSSANPSLDGSALKKSLQRYMSNLQINIKAIVETCYIEHSKLTQTQSDDVNLNEPTPENPEDTESTTSTDEMVEAIMEMMAASYDGVYLMEDAAREQKMELVNTTYGQMMQIYESSMQSALEKAQKETAMTNASQMMELAKKEEFIALFPTFTGSFGGKPQTIDAAVEAVDGLVKEFVETMKKVIVLAKGSTIDETTLSKVIEDLSMMSLMMQNYFGAKSLLDDDMQARVEKMLAQREENQSLSDEPKSSDERSGVGILGKAKELVGKGLEKLKQMFGWLGEETLKLLANLIDAPDLAKDPMFIKFVEPFGELIVKQGGELTAKSEGSPEVKQVEELMVKTLESKSWFDSLKPEQQSVVTELIDGIYKDKRMLQELDMSSMGVVPSEVRDQISSEYQFALVSVLKKMDEEKQNLLTSLMSENEDEFVSYLVNQHELRQKMGEEKTKAIGELTLKTSGPLSPKGTDSSKQNADEPTASADSDIDAEVPDPENLGKDTAPLEDVDGFDDSKEEPDVSGSPEDEDDIADFKREVKSLDSFLPLVQKPSDPIAKKIQPIKDSFTTTLAKKKILQGPLAKQLFNKFFLLIFKQMNKDLVMEDAERFAKTLIPKIKQDMKNFVTSLGSDELKPRDFNFFFNNIKEVDLTNLIAIIRKHKAQIAKIVYGEKGQVAQDNSEKAVRGKEVTLQEALKPIIEKMLKEHYNH